MGLSTTVTGGQGTDKLAQAIGMCETSAAATDLIVSVTGNQPLDYVTIAATSRDKAPKTGVAPKLQENQAKRILINTSKGNIESISEVGDATDTIMNKIGKNLPNATVNSDGSVVVPTSKRAYIQTLQNIKNGDIIQVPNIGPADVVVVSKNNKPIVTSIDSTTSNLTLNPNPISGGGLILTSTKVLSDNSTTTYIVTVTLNNVTQPTDVNISVNNGITGISTQTLNQDGSLMWKVVVSNKDAIVTVTRLDANYSTSITLKGTNNQDQNLDN